MGIVDGQKSKFSGLYQVILESDYQNQGCQKSDTWVRWPGSPQFLLGLDLKFWPAHGFEISGLGAWVLLRVACVQAQGRVNECPRLDARGA